MLRRFGRHLRNQWMGATALFLVLCGGTAYAVTQIDRNSVESKHIVNGQVKSGDVRDDGLSGGDINESSLGIVPDAANADSLGGSPPAAFQGYCEPGAIKGSVKSPTPPVNSFTYVSVSGFNCINGGTGEVRMKLVDTDSGLWHVWFVNNPGAGTAVVSPNDGGEASVTQVQDPEADTAAQQDQFVFRVRTASSFGGDAINSFTLLAF